jgi:hypothetical protein
MNMAVYFLFALFANPFTGAAVRNWQGCCLQFSENVALYLFPFLLIGLSARFISSNHRLLSRTVSWLGLGIWCLGAPVSFLHALS